MLQNCELLLRRFLQAREWESNGEYGRAVDCYIKINNKVTMDKTILEKSWVKVRFQILPMKRKVTKT